MLRAASLARLNSRMRNKRQEMTLPFTTNISLEELEPSTLSANDKAHLKRWLEGVESGRACMLAMLDASHAAEQERSDAPPESSPAAIAAAAAAAAGSAPGPSLQLALLSASVNLPADFLCTGFLYEHVFSKPPVSVVREALHLLLETAQESAVEALDCHQINLAIKQVRIGNLARAAAEGGEEEEDGDAADGTAEGGETNKENRRGGGNASRDAPLDDEDKEAKAERHRRQTLLSQARLRRAREEETRLQIMLELIHLHAEAQQRAQHGPKNDDDEDYRGDRGAEGEAETPPPALLARDIHSHLLTPLDQSESIAAIMPAEELERSNALLKPYISRLACLREALRFQLAELEKNEAFFSLGLAQGCDCSDAQIKRAYHSLAVRLHPDKGGDTKKFQELQDAYQEVLRKKREHDVAKVVMGGGVGFVGGVGVLCMLALPCWHLLLCFPLSSSTPSLTSSLTLTQLHSTPPDTTTYTRPHTYTHTPSPPRRPWKRTAKPTPSTTPRS